MDKTITVVQKPQTHGHLPKVYIAHMGGHDYKYGCWRCALVEECAKRTGENFCPEPAHDTCEEITTPCMDMGLDYNKVTKLEATDKVVVDTDMLQNYEATISQAEKHLLQLRKLKESLLTIKRLINED